MLEEHFHIYFPKIEEICYVNSLNFYAAVCALIFCFKHSFVRYFHFNNVEILIKTIYLIRSCSFNTCFNKNLESH